MIINDKPKHFSGLSTDTKPNLGVAGQGYLFSELDTGLEFAYDNRIGSWVNISRTSDTACTGIVKIEKTSSEGLIDFYTIYFTNGSQTTFTVTNGTKVTISDHNTWLLDGKDTEVQVTGNQGAQGLKGDKGDKGDQGERGVSITDVYLVKTEGLTDLYCIKFSNDTHTDFRVTNGLSVASAEQVGDIYVDELGDTITTIQFKGQIDLNDESIVRNIGVPVKIHAKRGEKGEQGPQGERGPQGEKGEPGEKGEQGPMGYRGFKGEQGPKGDRGEPGDTGLQGEKGDKGEKGDNGLTPYIGENTNWWIGNEDTGIYAKGSDEKYNIIKTGGSQTVQLQHNNAFICKKDLNRLNIVFPGNTIFPEDDSIVPGWISEITFKGSVLQDYVFLNNIDTTKIKYYKFGRLRTGIHFDANSTINLIFQYDGLNVYCYITEISDDIAVD